MIRLAYSTFIIFALLILWAVLFYPSICHAQRYSNNQIANAIYKVENSVKFPYGIRSINTYGNKVYARKICLNSIRNARKRCVGKDLVVCMGQKYSPPKQNPNWCKLVYYFLLHPTTSKKGYTSNSR